MKESKQAHKSSDKKHKKKHKHASEKKQKKKSHRRDSDSSGSSDAGEDAHSQLQRERAAVQQTRHLLAAFPAVRKDLRQLLWALDNGKAVGLEGVPDPELRQQLVLLLEKLQLKDTKGQYWLPKGSSATLSVVGFVFDEVIQPLPARAPAAPAASKPLPAPAAGAADEGPSARQATQCPASPTPSTSGQEQQRDSSPEPAGVHKEELAEEGIPGRQPLGPQLPQRGAASAAGDDRRASSDDDGMVEVVDPQELVAGSSSPSPPPSPARRRVVGPAMPAPELLAAAAAFAAATEAAGGYGPAPDELAAAGDDADDMMIGPPPPEFIEADEGVPQDERTGEVTRVLRVLRDTERQAAAQKGPSAPKAAAATEPGAPEPDAYAVLGVEPSTPAGAVRKRYWKLSLLVHPDKCSAVGAQEAFQAVAKAAATLQDAAARRKLDDKRTDAELWRMAQQAAEQAERERQWRVARGEEPASGPGSTAGAHLPLSRETWMTELPAERARTAPKPTQVSVTSFSRLGPKPERGDTSGWTDTPEMRVARAQGLLQDAEPRLLTGSGGLTGADGAPPPAVVAAAVAGYNTQHRQKSMLEKHAERRAAGGKKEKQKGSSSGVGKKRAAEGPPAGTSAEWVGNHPWRPFDKEKDMAIAKTPKTAAALLKDAAGLGSRFASGR